MPLCFWELILLGHDPAATSQLGSTGYTIHKISCCQREGLCPQPGTRFSKVEDPVTLESEMSDSLHYFPLNERLCIMLMSD